MNALTRIRTEVAVTEAEPEAPPFDPALYGVLAAIALWALLHFGLAVSWLSAGRI